MEHTTASHQASPSLLSEGSQEHFKGKNALDHVLEKRASSFSEPHGSEMPDHLSAAIDTARQLAFFLMILYVILDYLQLPQTQCFLILSLFACGGLIGLVGRRAWLGWTHLERLHRLLEQERYEIEHHRSQERDELKALYSLKGFEGDLLEQVVDVLMADDDRLLKVMLEEEMGLSLGTYEHPLKQSAGAAIGGLTAIALSFISLFLFPDNGIVLCSIAIVGVAGALSAYLEQNRVVPAFIWNAGIGVLSLGIVYFLLKFFAS